MISHADIAKAAGVSESKVSRALSGKNINREEAERIKSIARQMGYHGNRMARGIKTGKSHIIGCLVTNRLNPWDSELIAGIQEAAVKADYLVAFADWSHSPDTSLRLLLEYRMDGLILTSIIPNGLSIMRDLMEFTVSGRPIAVTYDWPLEKEWGAVSVDFEEAAVCLVSHLADLGHTRIAFGGGWVIGREMNPRLKGYIRGLEAKGLAFDPRLIFMDPKFADTFEGGLELGSAVACLVPGPTAVMAYNDIMAMGVIRSLSERGISVPRDMSVCGFDGLRLSSYHTPNLTTISTDNVDWGRRLTEAILEMQGGGKVVRAQQNWSLNAGGTAGPVCCIR